MKKKIVAGALGFVLGLLLFAAGREIALDPRSWSQLFSDAMRSVGRFGWVDTTLVTGVAAVAAAYLSISAVQQQITQERTLEDERRTAKLTAARSVLALSLSNLCEYATDCANKNHQLLMQCGEDQFPESITIPEFPSVPDAAIAVIKEMVEFSNGKQGRIFATLASKLQVQSARVRGMKRDKARGILPSRHTIEAYLVDALEVYARCSALFAYARFEEGSKAVGLEHGDLAASIHKVGIYSGYVERIADRCSRYEEVILPEEAIHNDEKT